MTFKPQGPIYMLHTKAELFLTTISVYKPTKSKESSGTEILMCV